MRKNGGGPTTGVEWDGLQAPERASFCAVQRNASARRDLQPIPHQRNATLPPPVPAVLMIPPPADIRDQLVPRHTGFVLGHRLSEHVEMRQGVLPVDPVGLQPVRLAPLEQLLDRPVAVDVAEPVSLPRPQARDVTEGRVEVELDQGPWAPWSSAAASSPFPIAP